MSTAEFTPALEAVTAALSLEQETGESFEQVAMGYYPCNESGEVWIQCNGHRFNIPPQHVEAFVKQLRRTAKLAKATP